MAHSLFTSLYTDPKFPPYSVFEYTNISPRLKSRLNVLETLHETGPDLSHKRAMSTVTGYLSGVSPSMLAFLVFGTTKPFQRKMYQTFVPAFIRNRNKPEDDDDEFFGCRQPAQHSTYLPNKAGYTPNSSGARASTAAGSSVNGKSPRFAHRSLSLSSSAAGAYPPQIQIPTYPGSPIQAPPSPQFSLSHKGSKSSLRNNDPQISSLNPIYEPITGTDALWLDISDATHDQQPTIRRSQIGLAISKTPSPEPPPVIPPPSLPPQSRGTFLRDETDSSSAASSPSSQYGPTPPPAAVVPTSRFSSRKGPPPPSLQRQPSMTVTIWSEGRADAERPSSRRRSTSRTSIGGHHRRFSSSTRDGGAAPQRLVDSRQGNVY